MRTPAQLQARIPFVYKALLLWFEPMGAFLGSLMLAFKPDEYFRTMTPRAPAMADNPEFMVVFYQLAAVYFLFAFNEAVVLRLTSELRVWKAMLLGIACCDVIHLCASGNALGLEVMMNPLLWRSQDWTNFLMLYIPLSMRLAFCLGVGIKPETTGVKRE